MEQNLYERHFWILLFGASATIALVFYTLANKLNHPEAISYLLKICVLLLIANIIHFFSKEVRKFIIKVSKKEKDNNNQYTK